MNITLPVILASQSPRRQQLLREIGVSFEVITRPVDEFVPKNMHPRAVAVFIAENKAKAYEDLAGENLIITADTIVAVDEEILGKPADESDAFAMLHKLSGRSHSVVSGVTLFYQGKLNSFAEETDVTFATLSDTEIQHYIDTEKPFDKAGAYGIQDWIGKIGITGIEGDYYNVMGLPLQKLYTALKQFQ